MPSKSAVKKDRFAKAAERTATAERAIQKNIDRKEASRKPKKANGAMQAGARRYPELPLPKQHIAKPGKEAELKLAPMYDAPHKGIRVNAVAPGPVWTPLNPADRNAESVAKFGGGTPMKRPAQPEEISPAYVFLAAPSCSSYITGVILPIIGGYSGG